MGACDRDVCHCLYSSLEGRYKATWKREFKLPWRKAGLLKSTDILRTSGR